MLLVRVTGAGRQRTPCGGAQHDLNAAGSRTLARTSLLDNGQLRALSCGLIVCCLVKGGGADRVKAFELTDLDIDQQLLALPGASLLVFTSVGCSSCRWARQQLPGWNLPVARICWVDAGHNGGAVARYGIFHLPALFVVCEGQLHGALQVGLNPSDLSDAINEALQQEPEELP